MTGAQSSSADLSNTIRCSRRALPWSTRAKTAATSSTLKVLHIRNRWFPRCAKRWPVSVSSTATPRRPPCRCSSAANDSGNADVPSANARVRCRTYTAAPVTEAFNRSRRCMEIPELKGQHGNTQPMRCDQVYSTRREMPAAARGRLWPSRAGRISSCRARNGPPEAGSSGGKWCQNMCNVWILEGISGLQSRLRRFDSDPSLQNAVP